MHFIRSLWTIHSHIVDFQHQQIGAPLNLIRLGFESLLGFHEALRKKCLSGMQNWCIKGTRRLQIRHLPRAHRTPALAGFFWVRW